MTPSPGRSPREVLAAEWTAVRAWIDLLPPEVLDRPCVLDGWTVRDLVAHLGRAIGMLAATDLDAGGAAPLSFATYVGQYAANAGEIAEGTRALAAAHADTLDALLDASWSEASAWLDAAGDDGRRVVLAKRGPLRLADLVTTRTLELVVHGDDLARSVPEVAPPQHDRDALRAVVKLLLGVLTERAPGRNVEVRVPPFAAVQAIEGGAHTRGTPPNTVEADALTWVRVACGRVAWVDAVTDGSLRASGIHADAVAAHLPLL